MRASKLTRLLLIGAMVLTVAPFTGRSARAASDGPPAITASEQVKQLPEWAVLERKLIDRINEAAPKMLDQYTRDNGHLLWPSGAGIVGVDGLDDMYESFHNWPLFYMLGGDGWFLEAARRQFNAINEQAAQHGTGRGYPLVVEEYQPSYDWFHQGEGNLLFYMLSMAGPEHEPTRKRARRFAGYFMGEDPKAPNYDAEQRLFRSPHIGSVGPGFWNFSGNGIYTAWGYGLPFYDVQGIDTVRDLKDKQKKKRLAQVAHRRRGRGDVAMNLASTSLMTNAYLLTGEGKYRKWVRRYVNAWRDRTERNDGILPDNVGLNGEIGAYTNGKWYGGNYGWTFPHGWKAMGHAVGMAAENAALVTRDPSAASFPRSQLRMLAERGIERDGKLYLPHKHGTPGEVNYKAWQWLPVLRNDDGDPDGDSPRQRVGTTLEKDGWFHFAPMHPMHVGHLWNLSASPKDMKLADRLSHRDGAESLNIPAHYHTKDMGGHDGQWLDYLQGEFPGYPEKILKHNLRQVERRMKKVRKEKGSTPNRVGNAYFQKRNPVTCEGLVHLTLGGPLPLYNGGLLMTELRYFDPARQRPGLPKDVAALIPSRGPDRITVRLVNTSEDETRNLIVQAGSMAQHRFTTAERTGRDKKSQKVNGPRLTVKLPPSGQITLKLGLERFARKPRYTTPW